ncbi:MAG: AarF/ABC1/UbiB kinase family protein [Blastocatellia bacterium]|nr:AarF/ABC1/UbiB kinase family protein [Blastocatellia bacterium]
MAAMIEPEKCSVLRATPRLIQILRVLARHKFLGALLGKRHWPPPKEVRETVEELGLTFIKFGQVLAMRRDLLPDAYIDELERLHDQLPAMGIDEVRATVEVELGSPLTELFSSFSETPLAAATIAQVHEATMQGGRHVAVKVQRPCLKAMISTDITALTYLVALGERLFPRLRALDLPVVVSEFAKTLNRETDFSREARSIALFRKALGRCPRPLDSGCCGGVFERNRADAGVFGRRTGGSLRQAAPGSDAAVDEHPRNADAANDLRRGLVSRRPASRQCFRSARRAAEPSRFWEYRRA